MSAPGFDPSRVVAVAGVHRDIVVESADREGLHTGDKYIWARHPDRPHLDVLLATVHYNYAYLDNSTIGDVAERVASVVANSGGSIATEVRGEQQ